MSKPDDFRSTIFASLTTVRECREHPAHPVHRDGDDDNNSNNNNDDDEDEDDDDGMKTTDDPACSSRGGRYGLSQADAATGTAADRQFEFQISLRAAPSNAIFLSHWSSARRINQHSVQCHFALFSPPPRSIAPPPMGRHHPRLNRSADMAAEQGWAEAQANRCLPLVPGGPDTRVGRWAMQAFYRRPAGTPISLTPFSSSSSAAET